MKPIEKFLDDEIKKLEEAEKFDVRAYARTMNLIFDQIPEKRQKLYIDRMNEYRGKFWKERK